MWYKNWFNQDYLNLYSKRGEEEGDRQVDLMIELLTLNGSEKIIDLGCGAGRHCHAFASRGFDITGVDQSKELIEIAKKGPGHFIHADILSFSMPETFDLALSLFTSFGYFRKDDDNLKFFIKAHESLKKGGSYFLEYLHPFSVRKSLVHAETSIVKGETVTITRQIEDDTVVKRILFPGRSYEERVKLYNRTQIEKMLIQAGFDIQNVWNDYQGNPFKEEGDRQIFHAIRS